MKFWPNDTLAEICKHSNLYACQANRKTKDKTNGGESWTDIKKKDLLGWLGICIFMGLKKLPQVRSYWEVRPFFGCPVIKSILCRDRFEAILRSIHLVNNDTLETDKSNPAYDKLAKCRWLFEKFITLSQSLYNCERFLTVDEIMIAYSGRYCPIQQYMKNKPIKHGMKIWGLACSKSRYLWNAEVYLGSQKDKQVGLAPTMTFAEGEKPEKKAVDLGGEGCKVVLNLVKDLKHRGHVVVTDNYFTSPALHDKLLKEGFWATGTSLLESA